MPGRRGRTKTQVQNNLLPIPVGLGQITAVAAQWRFFRREIFLPPAEGHATPGGWPI